MHSGLWIALNKLPHRLFKQTNKHSEYTCVVCVTLNGLFAVDSTEWQIYSINRYQIITIHFITCSSPWIHEMLFNANVKIAHTMHPMKCNILLTYPDWIWDFDLHICFSHPKSSPALDVPGHVQPHPYILYSSGRHSSELNHIMSSSGREFNWGLRKWNAQNISRRNECSKRDGTEHK